MNFKEYECGFAINERFYKIYDVDKIQGKLTYVGVTDYENATIFIEKSEMEDMIKTLVHEVMHVWMYENGYENQEGGCFSYEDVCEFAAQAYELVQEVVEHYKWEHERLV